MVWRDSADEEQPLPAGTVIDGRYRLIAEIGAGGMGRVYEAEHMFLRRRMALKLLRGGQSSAEAAARMVQEATLAGQVPHPAIVRVLDCADLGMGRVYVAMELLRGESLAQALRRPGRAVEVLPWLADVARGLAAVHRVGVVHRDVKPANVVLVRDAAGAVQAKLLDFGVAKSLGGAGGAGGVQTEAGAVLGTPFYLAPEQARGAAVDGRADLYALGVMLYEALTGELPFVGAGFMEIVAQHVKTPPLDPRQAAPERGIPDGVARLTMQLLAKDPQERPPDGDAVAEAITGLLTSERAALERLVTGPRAIETGAATARLAEGTDAGTVRLSAGTGADTVELAAGVGAGTVRLELRLSEGTGAGTVGPGASVVQEAGDGAVRRGVGLVEGAGAGTVRREAQLAEETGAVRRVEGAGARRGAWRSALALAAIGAIAGGIGWAVVRGGRTVAEAGVAPMSAGGAVAAPTAASPAPELPPAWPAVREESATRPKGAPGSTPAVAAGTAGAGPEKPGRTAPAGKKSPRDSGTTRAPPPPGKADPGGPALKTDVYDE